MEKWKQLCPMLTLIRTVAHTLCRPLARMKPTSDSQEVSMRPEKTKKHEQDPEKATQMHVIPLRGDTVV